MAKTSHISTPAVFLAPMSGVTDAPFRAAVRQFGVGTLVSEMVACTAMVEALRDRKKLRHVFDPDQPTVLQLAGTDPALFAIAVQAAQDRGATALDLNFGCPARKVTGKAAGSALMRDPDLCRRIFAAVGGVAQVPWSVKMRLGWDARTLNAPLLARAAWQAGASRVAVHGRTRCQFYKGQADWRAVAPVAAAIPLIVNGDIHDGASAAAALRVSGAAGYMVGRAATGLPWRLKEIECARRGQAWSPRMGTQIDSQRALLAHMLSFYGSDLGLRSYRKHLAAWLLHLDMDPPWSRALLTSSDPKYVDTQLEAVRQEDRPGACSPRLAA